MNLKISRVSSVAVQAENMTQRAKNSRLSHELEDFKGLEGRHAGRKYDSESKNSRLSHELEDFKGHAGRCAV